jgi:hypothetical protein
LRRYVGRRQSSDYCPLFDGEARSACTHRLFRCAFWRIDFARSSATVGASR